MRRRWRTKEYSPQEYYAFKGMNAEEVSKEQAIEKSLIEKFSDFLALMKTMPTVMKRLAVVQFFSWFSLFIMWVYTMPAIAQQVWGIDVKWFDPSYITSVGGVPQNIAEAKGAAGDWVGIYSPLTHYSPLFSQCG